MAVTVLHVPYSLDSGPWAPVTWGLCKVTPVILHEVVSPSGYNPVQDDRSDFTRDSLDSGPAARAIGSKHVMLVQGHLAHKKQRPPRTLQ